MTAVLRLDMTPEEVRFIHALMASVARDNAIESARAQGMSHDCASSAVDLACDLMLAGSAGVLGRDGIRALFEKTRVLALAQSGVMV